MNIRHAVSLHRQHLLGTARDIEKKRFLGFNAHKYFCSYIMTSYRHKLAQKCCELAHVSLRPSLCYRVKHSGCSLSFDCASCGESLCLRKYNSAVSMTGHGAVLDKRSAEFLITERQFLIGLAVKVTLGHTVSVWSKLTVKTQTW
jgi:hypothetical protein